MDQQTFRHINHILARDNKSSTYKFALLRGTIELIEDNSPFIVTKDNRAHFPLELLVEKWLLYYYPLVSAPQINKSTQLAFAGQLKAIIYFYDLRGGFKNRSCMIENLSKRLISVILSTAKINLSNE